MPTLSALGELSPNVIAALFGAGATLVAALINLRIAWRREVLDRLQTVRGGRRARRGLLIAISILVVASGVGGYAGAMYMMQRDQRQTKELRAELQQRIGQIQETAARFEQTRHGERTAIEAEARLLEDRRRGADGIAAVAVLGPCRARQSSGDASEKVACGEAEAVQGSACASIPAAARVYEVVPHARWADDGADWSERRVALGGRLANAAFGAQPSERAESGASKRVCVDASTWDSERALELRVLVKYLPAEPASPPPTTPAVQAAVKIGP
jgi:hypothetical protein